MSADFDECPSVCGLTRGKKEKQKDCHECPAKELFAKFKADCLKYQEIRNPRNIYSFEDLLRAHTAASSLNNSIGGEVVNPRWTTRTAALVSIIRHEEIKKRRLEAEQEKLNDANS